MLRTVNTTLSRSLAYGFRVSGSKKFISAYCRRNPLLLSSDEVYSIATRLRLHPGPFLVFGAGNDSIFWATVNRGHATVFLEDDPLWLSNVRDQWGTLDLRHVSYNTRLDRGVPEQIDSVPPTLELPEEVRRQGWLAILVDAPQGWGEGPGRSQSIHEASRLVAAGGRIFVHDCDRAGEQSLVGRFLEDFRCEALTPRLWFFER